MQQAGCPETSEQQALAANDIRVLVSQLNEAIQNGAAQGLRVEINVSGCVDVKGPATYYSIVSARILTEVL